MAFKNILILQCKETGINGDLTVKSQKQIMALVERTSISMQYKSEYADYKTEYQATVWKNEFEKDNFTHAVYQGVTYNINNIGRLPNDRLLKLMLSRG